MERLKAGDDVRSVRIGRAEALNICEGRGGRRHVGGKVRIDRVKIVLDMCMNKVRKEARDRKVVNCSLLEKGDIVGSEGDESSGVSKRGTRSGPEGEVTERGMICPGTGGVGVNGVMEGEEIGRTGLARGLEISPGGRRGTIVGKDEERPKIEMKGGTRTSTGVKGVGKDEFKGIKESVEGSEG